MSLKKILPLIFGSLCVVILFLGLLMFIQALKLNMILGIIIAALSLVHGMLTCDLTSLITLIFGVLIAIIPNWLAAVLLVVIGMGGAVVNLILNVIRKAKD